MSMSTINEFNQCIGEAVAGWTSAKMPSKSSKLTGKYCTLIIPVTEETLLLHLQDLFDAIWFESKGESWTYFRTNPANTIDEFRTYLTNLSVQSDNVIYVLIDHITRKAVGTIALVRITPLHGTVECGQVHFSKLMRRSSAGTEAVYLLMRCVPPSHCWTTNAH